MLKGLVGKMELQAEIMGGFSGCRGQRGVSPLPARGCCCSHPEIQLIALNSVLKHSVEARSSTVK